MAQRRRHLLRKQALPEVRVLPSAPTFMIKTYLQSSYLKIVYGEGDRSVNLCLCGHFCEGGWDGQCCECYYGFGGTLNKNRYSQCAISSGR